MWHFADKGWLDRKVRFHSTGGHRYRGDGITVGETHGDASLAVVAPFVHAVLRGMPRVEENNKQQDEGRATGKTRNRRRKPSTNRIMIVYTRRKKQGKETLPQHDYTVYSASRSWDKQRNGSHSVCSKITITERNVQRYCCFFPFCNGRYVFTEREYYSFVLFFSSNSKIASVCDVHCNYTR